MRAAGHREVHVTEGRGGCQNCGSHYDWDYIGPMPKIWHCELHKKREYQRMLCKDCGVNVGDLREIFYVHDQIWLSIVPSKMGMLCVGCTEKRLGRKLDPEDFTNAYVNALGFPHSQRLTERLKGGTLLP